MILRRLRSFALAVLLGFAAASSVPTEAAVLILANGDRLTGTVIRRANGRVFFHSEVLGDLIAAEAAVTIVDHSPVATPVESLAGLPPSPPATSAKPPAAPTRTIPSGPEVVKILQKSPAPVTPPVTPWVGKVEYGYENTETDVRSVNIALRADAERTVGKDDYLVKGRYLYAKSNGIPTTDRADGEFRFRHNLSPQCFTQLDSTFDTDKIREIHAKADQNFGMGFKVLQGLRQTVDIGAGATGEYLNAVGVQRGFDMFGNVFQDYIYKINGRYTFLEDASAQYSPLKQDHFVFGPDSSTPVLTSSARDYAYRFHSTLQGKITNHLSLNLHFEYEFDNAVVDPAVRAEQRISTTLGYGF